MQFVLAVSHLIDKRIDNFILLFIQLLHYFFVIFSLLCQLFTEIFQLFGRLLSVMLTLTFHLGQFLDQLPRVDAFLHKILPELEELQLLGLLSDALVKDLCLLLQAGCLDLVEL